MDGFEDETGPDISKEENGDNWSGKWGET